MARSTGKDHARINLDIWGDEDWLDLTPPAQHLYFVLWTSPQLSYCGTGDWRPAKIAAKAKGWTPAQVEAAAAELSERLFLLIDTDTEEFILRSWMKHDGLWRTPNMAVSMANARADLASRALRGVVVFEVLKIKKREPKSTSWERDAVASMLTQSAVNPVELEPFNPWANGGAKGGPKGGANPWVKGGPNGGGTMEPNPTANGGSNGGATPTPAPTPTSILQGGHQNPEGHQGAEHDPNTPPPRFCSEHPTGTGKPCRACGAAGDGHKAWTAARAESRLRELADCPSCDPKGWLLNDDGTPADHQTRCPAHDWETTHA
jgi:hypothetical protein